MGKGQTAALPVPWSSLPSAARQILSAAAQSFGAVIVYVEPTATAMGGKGKKLWGYREAEGKEQAIKQDTIQFHLSLNIETSR